jgi:hypothetical protein
MKRLDTLGPPAHLIIGPLLYLLAGIIVRYCILASANLSSSVKTLLSVLYNGYMRAQGAALH